MRNSRNSICTLNSSLFVGVFVAVFKLVWLFGVSFKCVFFAAMEDYQLSSDREESLI